MHTICFDLIYPFFPSYLMLPDSRHIFQFLLLTLLLFFLFLFTLLLFLFQNPLESSQCCSYPHGCEAILWITTKENPLFLLEQLPTASRASAKGGALPTFHAGILTGLPCTGKPQLL